MTMPGEENENEDREIPVEDEETTVDLDAADDADEGEEEEKKPNRAARKAERGRLLDELRQRDSTIADMRDRLSRTEGTLGELRQSMQDTRARTERADAADDPAEAELQDVYDRQEALAERIAAKGDKITEAELDKFKVENRKLDRQKLEIIAKRNAPQPQRLSPEAEETRAFQYANRDIFGDKAKKEYARSMLAQMLYNPNPALRKPNTQETLQEAIDMTRKAFNPPAPTETEKARTSGVSRGGTGGGGKRDNVVTMSEFHKGLANKAFKHIKDEKERYKQWANGPGRKMLERKRASGGNR